MSTKRQSYEITLETLGYVQSLVLNAIKRSGGNVTRAEIADLTGMRISSVCARVNELLNAGLIQVAGTKKDFETNRQVEMLSTISQAIKDQKENSVG